MSGNLFELRGPIIGGGPDVPPVTPGTPAPVPPIPPAGAKPSPTSPSTQPSNVTSVKSPTDGTVQPGGPLWMRKWKLTVGTAAGDKAMDLSLLDFEFNVQQDQFQPPWTAKIKVWNVGENVVSRMATELTYVRLDAGYQSPSQQYGNVFSGQIAYYKHGRQNATDKYVEITATQWHIPINAAVVNTWLQAGHQAIDSIKAAMSAMAPYGVSLGQLPDDLSTTKAPRGRVLFGMARDVLRDIERTEGGHFFIDPQGKLHLLKDGEALKMGNQTVPILTPRTGLIDVATQVLGKGVEVQCLLNPAITPGTKIKIDAKSTTNSSVAQYQSVNPGSLPDTAVALSNSDFVFQPDGYYVVGSVRHQGQNRGNPWYSHINTVQAIPDVGPKTSA